MKIKIKAFPYWQYFTASLVWPILLSTILLISFIKYPDSFNNAKTEVIVQWIIAFSVRPFLFIVLFIPYKITGEKKYLVLNDYGGSIFDHGIEIERFFIEQLSVELVFVTFKYKFLYIFLPFYRFLEMWVGESDYARIIITRGTREVYDEFIYSKKEALALKRFLDEHKQIGIMEAKTN